MSLLRLTSSAASSPSGRPISERAVDQLKAPVRWGLRHAIPARAFERGARHGDPSARLVTETAGITMAELTPLLDELRASGLARRTPFSTVTVSHPVVRQVLGSPDFHSDFFGRITGAVGRISKWSTRPVVNPVEPPSLLAVDGEDHARYRKLVTRVFSVKAVERLRVRTEEVARELLDQIDAEIEAGGSGEIDLVERYCALLPVTVICEILGVPLEDRDRVLGFGEGAAAVLDVGLSWRKFRSVESSLSGFDDWLGDHLDRLRSSPGDTLLSQLVTARGDDGVGLTDLELKSIAGLVLAAGFETTVNLLGSGIALLAEHPDQRALLREQPDLWPNAVDEVLRYDPPVLLTIRVAGEHTEAAGLRFRPGDVMVNVLAGANRDPEVFTDPSVFDVSRANARDHVSFSSGRHYCLGAALARMEGEVGLRALFERHPELTLLPGATRRSTRILRGFETLPARLG